MVGGGGEAAVRGVVAAGGVATGGWRRRRGCGGEVDANTEYPGFPQSALERWTSIGPCHAADQSLLHPRSPRCVAVAGGSAASAASVASDSRVSTCTIFTIASVACMGGGGWGVARLCGDDDMAWGRRAFLRRREVLISSLN